MQQLLQRIYVVALTTSVPYKFYILGYSKSHCVFFNRWHVHVYLYTSVTWMSNVYARFVVETQPKNQKKSWRDSSFVLAIVVRTWRILKSIFAIFCFITSRKRRKQLKQGKSCVEFTAEMSLKNASVRTGSPDSVIVIF